MTSQAAQTITGTLTLLPSPCTTEPCLPGMALAIVTVGDAQYFLAKNGGFLQDLAGGGPMPQPGDTVVASGTTHDKRDTAGATFTILEFTTLKNKEISHGNRS